MSGNGDMVYDLSLGIRDRISQCSEGDIFGGGLGGGGAIRSWWWRGSSGVFDGA